MKMYFNFRKIKVVLLSIMMLILMTGCDSIDISDFNSLSTSNEQIDKSSIPSFNGSTYDITINNNKTYFTDDELSTSEYLKFSELDNLGRCGSNIACVSSNTVANTERGSIGMYKPSGWQTIRYDDLIKDKYLYNRSHIIMYKLYGNKTNDKRNLITGTRYFNANQDHGMLHYEMIALNYVKNSNNHLMYRCTPIYDGDNLVASGILIEAKSVEDDGEGLEFCVYVYNEQPNITINHKDGTSHRQTQSELNSLKENDNSSSSSSINYETNENTYKEETNNSNENVDDSETIFVININTKKFHKPSCSSAKATSPKNKENTNKSRQELINEGYEPCKICNP